VAATKLVRERIGDPPEVRLLLVLPGIVPVEAVPDHGREEQEEGDVEERGVRLPPAEAEENEIDDRDGEPAQRDLVGDSHGRRPEADDR